MIEATPEMEEAMTYGGPVRERLAAVLALAERDLRGQIAYRIRAELVCCEIFEQTHDTSAWEQASQGPHSICYWGEVAARLAAREVA